MEHNFCKMVLLESASYEEKMEINTMDKRERSKVDSVVLGKVYKQAIEKGYVDFDDVMESRGDITQFSGFANITELIEMMNKLSKESGMNIPELQSIDTAIMNMVSLKPQFIKGFSLDNTFVKLNYGLMTLSIVEALSLVVSSWVTIVSTPSETQFKLVKNHKPLSTNISIRAVNTFNDSVRERTYVKALNAAMSVDNREQEQFMGELAIIGTLGTVFIIGGTIYAIIPLMRELVFYYFYSRMQVSDFLKHQAYLLEINRENVKYSNLSPQKKKEVLKKQQKIANKFLQMSDKIKVNEITSQQKTNRDIKEADRQITLSEVKSETNPISNGGILL